MLAVLFSVKVPAPSLVKAERLLMTPVTALPAPALLMVKDLLLPVMVLAAVISPAVEVKVTPPAAPSVMASP